MWLRLLGDVLDQATDLAAEVAAQPLDCADPHVVRLNIGLEPVWPYVMIKDAGPLRALGVTTYRERPFDFENDWSFDPIQAARLGRLPRSAPR